MLRKKKSQRSGLASAARTGECVVCCMLQTQRLPAAAVLNCNNPNRLVQFAQVGCVYHARCCLVNSRMFTKLSFYVSDVPVHCRVCRLLEQKSAETDRIKERMLKAEGCALAFSINHDTNKQLVP